MNEYVDSLLRLPGTAEEQEWVRKHLETLSVREGVILTAAREREPPESAQDVINHLLSLDRYDVLVHVADYSQLGEYYLRESSIPREQQPYFDTAALGCWYEDEHPGLFADGCYVTYPRGSPELLYDGTHLPSDTERMDWSVRLKLASELVPGGVWVKLPDYDEINGDPGGLRLALDALRVKTIQECTLLDARCVLPEIHDLKEQYDDLSSLIYDGQNLGIVLDERGQGMRDFLERFTAALEYEGCRRLDHAVEIGANIRDYTYVAEAALHDYAVDELREKWWFSQDGVRECFDFEGYARTLLEERGFQPTSDGRGYIARPAAPEQDHQPGMTMQ